MLEDTDQQTFFYAPQSDWFDDLMQGNLFDSNSERQIDRKNCREDFISDFQNDRKYKSPDVGSSLQLQNGTTQTQQSISPQEGFTVSNSVINFDEQNQYHNQTDGCNGSHKQMDEQNGSYKQMDEQNGSYDQMPQNENSQSNIYSEPQSFDLEDSSQKVSSSSFNTQETSTRPQTKDKASVRSDSSPVNTHSQDDIPNTKFVAHIETSLNQQPMQKQQGKRGDQNSGKKENTRNRSNQPSIQIAYYSVTKSHIDKNCPQQFQRTLDRQLKTYGKHKLIKKLKDDKIAIKKKNQERNLAKSKNSQSNRKEKIPPNRKEKIPPNFTHQLFNEFFKQSPDSLDEILDVLDQNAIDEHINLNKKIGSSPKIKMLGEVEQKVMDKCIRQVHKEFHKCMKRKIIRKRNEKNYECKSFMDEEFRTKLNEISQDPAHEQVLEHIIASIQANSSNRNKKK